MKVAATPPTAAAYSGLDLNSCITLSQSGVSHVPAVTVDF
jgi:hypothetical protein